EMQVLAAHVIRFHEREHQPAPAVQKAEPEHIAAEEAPLRVEQHLAQAAPLAPRVERLRHELRIALHPLVMVPEAAIRVMLEVTLEPADASRDPGVLVDLPSHPAAAAAVEEAHEPVRIGIAVAEEFAEIIGDARHRPAGIIAEAALAPALDLRAQRVAHALVGIQAEHPLVARSVHRELLL